MVIASYHKDSLGDESREGGRIKLGIFSGWKIDAEASKLRHPHPDKTIMITSLMYYKVLSLIKVILMQHKNNSKFAFKVNFY